MSWLANNDEREAERGCKRLDKCNLDGQMQLGEGKGGKRTAAKGPRWIGLRNHDGTGGTWNWMLAFLFPSASAAAASPLPVAAAPSAAVVVGAISSS